MKKFLALGLVILMLAVSFVGCGNNILGTWSVSEDGVTMELTFEEDGKGTVKAMDMTCDLEWKIEDNKLYATMSLMGQEQEVFDGAEFSVKGDELTITVDGTATVLKKSK